MRSLLGGVDDHRLRSFNGVRIANSIQGLEIGIIWVHMNMKEASQRVERTMRTEDTTISQHRGGGCNGLRKHTRRKADGAKRHLDPDVHSATGTAVPSPPLSAAAGTVTPSERVHREAVDTHYHTLSASTSDGTSSSPRRPQHHPHNQRPAVRTIDFRLAVNTIPGGWSYLQIANF